MIVRRISRALALVACSGLVLVASCSSSVEPRTQYPVRIQTDAASYVVGQVTAVTVVNEGDGLLTFGACPKLQVKTLVSWATLPYDGRPCISVLYGLPPNTSGTLPSWLDRVSPGIYRYYIPELNVQGAAPAGAPNRFSNEFVVLPRE